MEPEPTPASPPVPPELADLVVARAPLTLELPGTSMCFQSGLMTVLGGLLLAMFAVAVAGWAGAIDMARDGFAVLATAVSLGGGLAALAVGLGPRLSRLELRFDDDVLSVTTRLGRWQRRRELARSWAGSADVMTRGLSGTSLAGIYGWWLAIGAEPPARPLILARGMGLDRAVLAAVAAVVDRWRAGAAAGARDRAPRDAD